MSDNLDLLYSIALMYYREGMNQQEISEKTKISRPMISRALAKAEKLGIVEVKVHAPEYYTSISRNLENSLNLKKVYIAPSGALTDFASVILENELPSEGNIGIGWGKTVYGTVEKMSRMQLTKTYKKAVVPLVSSLGIKEPHYQVNLIVSLMTQAIGGIPYFFNPSDSHIEELLTLWNKLDAVVMGMGSGYIASDEFADKKDIKGEILGKFFSKDGFLPYSWSGYSSIENSQLLKTEKRICMCEGSEKVASIIAASGLGLFNILITDKKTADELISAL